MKKQSESHRRKTLFKFDKTSQAMNAGPKEHRRNASDMSNDEILTAINEDKSKGTKSLVCSPDPTLIRKIYLPLLSYTQEIEEMIKSKPSQLNAFNEFLNTHIKDIFLAKGHNRNLQLTIESLAKNHDAWRSIITPEEMKRMELSRPLLQSTVLVEQSKFAQSSSMLKSMLMTNKFINFLQKSLKLKALYKICQIIRTIC